MKTGHALIALAALVGLVIAPGCRSRTPEISEAPVTPTAVGPNIPLDASEAYLIEQVDAHRLAYRRYLEALEGHYIQTGQFDKRKMAETELEGLRKVRQYRYLVVADAPPQQMTVAAERVAEADQLYEDGLSYYNHFRLPLFYDEDKLRRALEKFELIINRHPSSDKVDDAFFYAAEILKEFFNENLTAVEYYRRACLADPNTPHHAHYQRAVILDYRLHNRDEALNEYRLALEAEAGKSGWAAASRREASAKRIRQLSGQ